MNVPAPAAFAPYADALLSRGFCRLPGLLSAGECRDFIAQYDREQQYRSTIDMARYNFGSGQYRYFADPLPERIAQLRAQFYELLVATANTWSQRMKRGEGFPARFADYEKTQHGHQQTTPTPLILRYHPGDYNCLHQDISGEHYFPYQMIIALSQPGRDFDGGELVFTQQRPRMQTIPHIVIPQQGDVVIVTAKHHPCLGKRGYYRSEFRHGVAEVTRGERFCLGIIFHNYAGPARDSQQCPEPLHSSAGRQKEVAS